MNYDEIDQYVDQLFNKPEPGSSKGEVLSGDWRIERIDQVIQDAYNEAIWWHNNRISQGCDPRSGLRSLPYVPWDENIDGVAAMQGAAVMPAKRPPWERHGMSEAQYMEQLSAYQNRPTLASTLVVLALILIGFCWAGLLSLWWNNWIEVM